MAKKKRRTRKKIQEPVERSPFWAMAGSIIMILLAAFTMLGGFKAGGPLPEGLFDAAFWALGWAAYMVPIALVFFGIIKFTSEDHRIPLTKSVSMLAFLILFASWLHVAFTPTGRVVTGSNNSFGGNIGALIGGLTLNALTKMPASIMFLIFSMLAFFLAFNISPDILLSIGKIFKRPEPEADTDMASLTAEPDFKLNAGVPIVQQDAISKPAAKLASLKNSSKAPTAEERREALTTKSDPTWQLPSIDLLNQKEDKVDAGDVKENAAVIRRSLANFKINVEMEGANIGPRVTQYTLKTSDGVRLNKLASYADNLAYDLAAQAIRIEAPIPGKQAVGVEVPNKKPATVRVSSILKSKDWTRKESPLSFVVGKDIAGAPVMGDLAGMPHLLVAGQTGSGKSVMINTILTSLLYRNSPADMKLIMVDPKFVELGTYNGIPHLLAPVITEPEKCISALKWAVAEMERRLKTMAEINTSNIAEYNEAKQEEGMPYIVIVIDELADLMMVAARDVEALIIRIAQKARAAGIHLILATQRPSANVITGLIRANVPARIAFTVSSQIDSRIIIDQAGAEKLLGKGDMLFSTSSMPKPIRVQGALIDKSEVVKVTKFIKEQREPTYNDEVISQPVQLDGRGGVVAEIDTADEPMFKEAVQLVIESRKATTSSLQTRLRIGYGRAARLIESMEEQGIIGPAKGSRPRDVLVNSLDDVFGDNSSTETPPEEAQA